MSRAESPVALLVARQLASPGAAAPKDSLTIRSAGREVFLCESAGDQSCKLVAFDSAGTARLTLEVSRQDYTPRIAKWMQRCLTCLAAK